MERVRKAFTEIKKAFPFKGYMNCKFAKYSSISNVVLSEVVQGSRILDIGCGPVI